MILNTIPTIGIAASEEKLKLAAIFFDQIIPITTKIDIPKSLISKVPVDYERVKEIQNLDKKNLESDFVELQRSFKSTYLKEIEELPRDEAELIIKSAYMEGYNKAGNVAIIEILRQVNLMNIQGIPIYSESILLDRTLDFYKMSTVSKKVEIELINAPIIDVKQIAWDQISESKKDPDFILRVRKFGLFINKNYQGKELSYIIDDLSMQLEDYQSTCKKHGIELMNGSLKSLADSKSFFGTMGLVVCSMLVNAPAAAILTGTIGGALEILKMTVTINEVKDKYHSFIKESPISLFHDLEKLSRKSQQLENSK